MKITIRVRVSGHEPTPSHTVVLPPSAYSVLEDTTPSNGFEEVTQTAELCGSCKTPWCKGECI